MCNNSSVFWRSGIQQWHSLSLWLLIMAMPALCYAEFSDPTKPDYPAAPSASNNTTANTPDTLVLSAIWITASNRWATINGITARRGQTILHDVKIMNITRNTVVLNHNGHTETLRLLKSPYKNK